MEIEKLSEGEREREINKVRVYGKVKFWVFYHYHVILSQLSTPLLKLNS